MLHIVALFCYWRMDQPCVDASDLENASYPFRDRDMRMARVITMNAPSRIFCNMVLTSSGIAQELNDERVFAVLQLIERSRDQNIAFLQHHQAV